MTKLKLLMFFLFPLVNIALIIYILLFKAEKYECKARYSIKFSSLGGRATVLSQGEMNLVFLPSNTGVGVYSGTIFYREDGQTPKSKKVNRTFEFGYKFHGDVLSTHTKSVSINMNDTATDSDVIRYVYPGFHLNKDTYANLIELGSGVVASGEANNPQMLCQHQTL